ALDLVLTLEELTDTLDLVLRQLLRHLVRRDVRLRAAFPRERPTHPGELRSGLTLALLVTGVLADDADDALAADHFALVADLLDARTDLHSCSRSGEAGCWCCSRPQLVSAVTCVGAYLCRP